MGFECPIPRSREPDVADNEERRARIWQVETLTGLSREALTHEPLKSWVLQILTVWRGLAESV